MLFVHRLSVVNFHHVLLDRGSKKLLPKHCLESKKQKQLQKLYAPRRCEISLGDNHAKQCWGSFVHRLRVPLSVEL